MKNNKSYTSFEEIDRDLRRLQLQSQISKEELKLSFYKAKESVTPSNVLSGFFGGVNSSSFLLKLLTPLASFAITKFLSRFTSTRK